MSDILITDLLSATSLADTDNVIVDDGATTKRATVGQIRAGLLKGDNNLSDITDPSAARGNLGLGGVAEIDLNGDASKFLRGDGTWGTVAGGALWCGAAGGTANALTLTPASAITSYSDGTQIEFVASATNTGAATVNISGIGAIPLKDYAGNALAGGNLSSGNIYIGVIYSNTVRVINKSVTYDIEYLVVAGGGGGGYNWAGGGGGGGVLTGSISVTPGVGYAVAIGAGGAGATGAGTAGGTGGTSTFATVSATGGGGGGCATSTGATNGGSGGGAAVGSTAASLYGTGISGQGHNGGTGYGTGTTYSAAGGGGGAGSAGANGVSGQAGQGGSGLASSISGSSNTYGGGGGGGGNTAGSSAAGAGGSGGGGAGSAATTGTGTAGTANTGGGGGGGGPSNGVGGNGGSGVVIIRYLGSQRGTGGTVTSSGGYTIHTFTGSGTYTA